MNYLIKNYVNTFHIYKSIYLENTDFYPIIKLFKNNKLIVICGKIYIFMIFFLINW